MSGNSLGKKGSGLAACLLGLLVSGCQMLPDTSTDMAIGNRMSCGDRELSYQRTEAGLELEVGSESYMLEQVESASGSQYVATDGSQVEFWIRGERALVTLAGEELPECAYSSGPYLAGPVWIVTEVGGKPVMTHYRASMHFRADGRLGGRASCNHFTARWERLGDDLVIEGNAATRMACPTEVMDQEERFLGALSRVAGFSVNEQRILTLQDAEGEPIIRAEPRSGRGEPDE